MEREESQGRELQKSQVGAQAQQINSEVVGTEENKQKMQQQEAQAQQAQMQQQGQMNQGGLNG